MNSDYERLLLAAFELRGWLTPSEVAGGLTRDGYAVSDQMMTNWKSRGISKEGRLNASRIIGCRPHWLETGSGLMRDAPNTSAVSSTIKGFFPLISWVKAGEFCGIIDMLHPGDAERWIPGIKEYGKHTYLLRVEGDSMVSPYPGQKTYPPGCLIFVDPEKAVTNGCRVIAKISGDETATFKVYREEGGKRYLTPINPSYPVIEMTPDIQICGVVVAKTEEE